MLYRFNVLLLVVTTIFGYSSASFARETTKRVLVLGGGGSIGAEVVRAATSRGWAVTALGRTPRERLPSPLKQLFNRGGVHYIAADLSDANAKSLLRNLFSQNDIVINAAEPYRFDAEDIHSLIRANARLLDALLEAGYGLGSGKVYVRADGSPCAETPSDRLFDRYFSGRYRYPEDVPVKALSQFDPEIWATPYFALKATLAWMAEDAFRQHGLNIITTLPTYVVSGFDNKQPAMIPRLVQAIQSKGSAENNPLVSMLDLWTLGATRETRHMMHWTSWTTSVTVNAVSGTDVARGILLAAEKGKPGHRYQLGGIAINSGDLIRGALSVSGINQKDLPVDLHESREALRRRALDPTDIYRMQRLTEMQTRSGFLGALGADVTDIQLGASLMATMEGGRTSQKAEEELGYHPGTLDAIDRSTVEGVDFYKATGQFDGCAGPLTNGNAGIAAPSRSRTSR